MTKTAAQIQKLIRAWERKNLTDYERKLITEARERYKHIKRRTEAAA